MRSTLRKLGLMHRQQTPYLTQIIRQGRCHRGLFRQRSHPVRGNRQSIKDSGHIAFPARAVILNRQHQGKAAQKGGINMVHPIADPDGGDAVLFQQFVEPAFRQNTMVPESVLHLIEQ
jgi:hypothetical protein